MAKTPAKGPGEAVKKTADNAKIGSGKPGPGRPKGQPNKTTALLKDAILQAATKAGGKDGIVGYLTEQAAANPGPFLSLLGKVLPIQHAGDPDSPIAVTVLTRRIIDPEDGTHD